MLLEKIEVVQANKQAYVGGASDCLHKLRGIAFTALKCLSEYANVRITIFETKEAKQSYVGNFANNLIESFGQFQT